METSRKYWHASPLEWAPGSRLKGRGQAYIEAWGNSGFYGILEAYRPEGAIAHHEAVFMVDNDDNLDCCGGSTEWVLQVLPLDAVSKHDLNWSSEICSLISLGYAPDSPEIQKCADAYWKGKPHFNESIWEYLAKEVSVIHCEPY